MDKNFFDQTLKYNWDMVDRDRYFDLMKVNTYLALLDEPYKSFVTDAINITRYIPFKEFKQSLLYTFNLFKENIGDRKFYILLDSEKIGSEHWITALLWPYLKELNILGFISIDDYDLEKKLSKDNVDILVIDDAIYSGHHLAKVVDDFSDIENENQVIHFVLPYMSNIGYGFIKSLCETREKNCRFYYKEIIDSVKTTIDFSKYFPDENTDIYKYSGYYPKELFYSLYGINIFSSLLPSKKGVLYNKFKNRAFDVTPMYFDHKIASSASTLSTIYNLGIIANKHGYFGTILKDFPSRYKIELLEKFYDHYMQSKDINFEDLFFVGKTIGKGAFGTVVKAITKPTYEKLPPNSTVAIKILNITLEEIIKIEREISILKNVSNIKNTEGCSEYIVCYYDSFLIGNKYYIVMEYIEGYTLRKLINDMKVKIISSLPLTRKQLFDSELSSYELLERNSLSNILNFMIHMANAVKYLHDKNIVHRDIKPANIMLNDEISLIKLVDFGSACYTDVSKQYPCSEKSFEGTMRFMAPEILILGDISGDSSEMEILKGFDVWALGLSFYNFLFGNLPPGIAASTKLIDIARSEIYFPPHHNYNEDIITVIRKMLNKNYTKRSNIDEIVSDLNKINLV